MSSTCSLRGITLLLPDELKTLAVELQDLVQKEVGTTKFANVYNRIRQGVLGVRRERKTARVMQVCQQSV